MIPSAARPSITFPPFRPLGVAGTLFFRDSFLDYRLASP
jgi:hypothetical protein